MSSVLFSTKNLHELKLAKNQIGEEGAQSLAEGLAENTVGFN